MAAAGEAPSFTATDFRQALGAFATGVTVVTTRGGEHAYGMTANAFSSLSLDPPLVLVCVRSGAEGTERIGANRIFAVNILAAHQEPISRYFASTTRPRGREAFRDVTHVTAVTGAPILADIAAYLDCRLHDVQRAGDHHIFIGEVLALGVSPEAEPLLFHGGRYRLVAAGE
jgi:flavin reductase (DIM6/NTAB) family NADH-FMN oxidoreductase RutF